jgi:long-chain acyl-CoA synthetase
MNLCELVDRHAEDLPDHPALIIETRSISYAQLRNSINKLANAFTKFGLTKGDRIIVLLPNRPEFVATYFACLKIGAIAVTLNPSSTVHELTHYFAECKPAGVACLGDQISKIDALKSRFPELKVVISTESADQAITFAQIESDYSDKFTALDLQPNDPAVIIFTAGLLGKAYGATLSHSNLDSNSIMLQETCKGDHNDHGLALIPLFHAFGAAVNMLNIFRCGGTVYLVEKVDFPKVIPWLKTAGITFCGLVPMVYYGLLYHPSCRDLELPTLRINISGGAALSQTIYDNFTNRYKIDIFQGYGLTEASPVVSWNNINIANKPSTVGKAIPNVTYEIHDENGKPLPAYTEGEVVVNGPNIMTGYFDKPRETETVIRNGWLYTGDLGHIDEDGYLTLTGLKKDLIITAGFNVYCQEVEEILIRYPGVRDVALVGVDDLMRGKVIEALVIPEPGQKPDEREMIRFCKEYLSRYKCPRKIVFVSEIIRNEHGKPSSWH